MRHRYLCPLRWGDMDMLGHVNNVRYVDYLQEARVDLFRSHSHDRYDGGTPGEALVEGIVVVRHEVTFLRPLLFSRTPVTIEVWVTRIRTASFTLSYEIFHERPDGTRRVYLRASTVLAPYRFDVEQPRRLSDAERAMLEQFLEAEPAAKRAPAVAVRPAPERHYPVHVRFSDVDVYRHVNNVMYFEYFQEARIQLITDLAAEVREGARYHFVVAQTDVDYHRALTLRPEPYDCWTRVASVGSSSVTMEATITAPEDGQTVLARARVVLVLFDPATQRPTPFPEEHRALLEGLAAAD
ncbi:thioesterase family protein [Nocardioides sp. YIM 152588]|uniref:acyl-CoA thioesterase n=1 Tax=Nocardioides sp. YIM 152588 TaxID=3158259 RepID=UPI0032E4A496